MEPVAELDSAWAEIDRERREPPEQDREWLRGEAMAFLSGSPSDDNWGETPFMDADDYQRRNAYWRFWHLLRSAPEEWMPIAAREGYRPRWGVPITRGLWLWFDGKRRLALAGTMRAKRLRVTWQKPVIPSWITCEPYQTIVAPEFIVAGERPPDRWPLLPDMTGKRIVELGCAEGMHGILAVRAGARSYLGVETDPLRVAVAAKLADAWGVADRVRVVCADALSFVDFMPADVLWCMSSAIQLGSQPHMRALTATQAKTVVLETHRLGDPESAKLMADIGLDWRYLGSSALDQNGALVRRLFVGER